MNRFKIRTEVRFNQNALDTLKEFKGKSAVIITDKFMVSSGMIKKITDKMEGYKSIAVFDEVTPDPTTSLIAKGLKFITENRGEIVIALGGGSPIDAAKAIVFMAEKSGMGDLKLIAIPTTSGTGSEVTKFAVITDDTDNLKYPLVDEGMLPDLAILDPALVETAPPSITADTGMDVITHAFEALVSVNANDASDALAEKALLLAFKYLPYAFKDGSDIVAREKMHSASCLAGMAFNEVGLGINHGIAHALGAKFHIPHGRANAILLPHVIRFNAHLRACFGAVPCEAAQRYADISRKLSLPHDNVRIAVESLIDEVRYMLRRMGIPATLWEAGISPADFEREKENIISAALEDLCTASNPREVDHDAVELLLNKIAPVSEN
ncbi:MAG: iron-containing alcohol dehydrogenase [Clostridia bacterium]|nr:iron-containing alcohol dehydrogenase [Clostridia bacterium]